MKEYNIDLKYINSHEGFILAVFACIYEELKQVIKAKDTVYIERLKFEVYVESARKSMSRVLRSYQMLFKVRKDPVNVFTETSDMLEMIDNSTVIIKLQENVDNLLEFFDDKIIINVKGNNYNYYTSSNLLPDFHDKILFKAID